MNPTPIALALSVALMFAAAPGSAQRVVIPDEEAVLHFQRAAEDYALLHRQLERRLGPIEVTANTETLRRAIDTMAAAIRAARPDARQGDLFVPAVQDVIRERIARSLRSHDMTPADVRAAGMAERADRGPVTLQVNGAFPWAAGAAMFTCILEALPTLPPELQYRIVGNDLVLIDVHASLIVDLLPYAIGDSEDSLAHGGGR